MTETRSCTYARPTGRGNQAFSRSRTYLPVLAVLLLLLLGRSAAGQTLAFFPLQDLTVGPNGTNPVLTDLVRREIKARGFELAAENEVMQFMIRHRIRTLGMLTSHMISLAGEELGVDLVLQGTVCQFREDLTATVSLSLQLMRTSDASPVWAHSEGLYYTELLTLLGLSDPETMDDLYEVFFSRLLEDLPRESRPAEKPAEEKLDVDSVVLQPEYARPGETVACRIRLISAVQDPESLPGIVARIGEEEHPMAFNEDGYFFETSWPAQDRAGAYTVTLEGNWPSGQSRSGVIGTYYVDTKDPGLRLHVIGKELDGRTAFSDRLVIVPRLIDPEPVTRWLIQVVNEEGEVIVNQGAAEHIPVRLIWQGKTNQGSVPPDGEYNIIFTVWDRAQYESIAETEVSFRRRPPEIDITVSRDNGRITVVLENAVATPISFWWMKFFDTKGGRVKLADGEVLPATIEFDLPQPEEGGEQVLEGLLQVRDIMGNQTTIKVKNLLLVEETGINEEVSLEAEWVEEF